MSGVREDSDEFCRAISTTSDGKNCARNYSELNDEAYRDRVEKIYVPKADFLLKSLEEDGLDFDDIIIFDMGAGSGYFISAMLLRGCDKVCGYEASQFQVDYGNLMLKRNVLKAVNEDLLYDIIKNSVSSVFSLVGCLEHLKNPMSIMDAICKNKNVKYIFTIFK